MLQIALEGFMRSNNISKKDLFKKKIDKGEFYFFKTKSKKLNVHDLLEEFVPLVLQKIQWKKSMKWGEFDLNWGRPLKSILALFDKKKLTFIFITYHHQIQPLLIKSLKNRKKYLMILKNIQFF